MTTKTIIRYSAAVCCLSDYFLKGETTREENSLASQNCINSIKEFGQAIKEKKLPKEADYLWSAYTKGKEGITIPMIANVVPEEWNTREVLTEYKTVAYDLKAWSIFKRIFISNGGNIYKAEEVLELYRFKILQIVEGRQRIDKPLRWACLNLEEDGVIEPSLEDVRSYVLKYQAHNKELNARAKNF